jgi:hypothetical protein
LELCEIKEKKNGTSKIRTRRMLKLPAVQPDTHVILEKFDETSSVTGSPSALRCPSTFPFKDPPRDSVLAFYVGASSRSGKKQALLFSVFTSTLRNFTATVGTTRKRWGKRRHKRIPTVPWNEWGPELTRWINVEDIPMIRTFSGTRCVISERPTGRVRVLDFDPESLRWNEEWIKPRTGETEGRDWQMMTSPTTIPAGEIFQYDIESKLPYYEVMKAGLRVEADFTFFIDDNCVVLISRPDVIDGSAVHSVLDSST